MLRISELISAWSCGELPRSDLVVDQDAPVREVLDRMSRQHSDSVTVNCGEQSEPAVITRQQLLDGLVSRFEHLQAELDQLRNHLDSSDTSPDEAVLAKVGSFCDTFEVAAENISDGLVIFGVDDRIEKANRSAKRMMGLENESDLLLLSKAFDRLGLRELINCRSDEVSKSGQIRVRVGTDKILDINWYCRYCNGSGGCEKVMIMRDITELIRAERSKTDFLTSISHELRTPLTSIQNSVSNMLAGVTGKINSRVCQYLHVMKSDCHRLADLINDLVDMAKIDAGSMPITRCVMNMSAVMTDVVKKHGHQAMQKGVELSYQIDQYIWPVYADFTRIRQVLGNLVDNAIRYTEPGGKVSITCTDNGKEVVTVVQDTGTGISPEHQKLIFNKFYQVHRKAGPGSHGNGLGLAICNGIIIAHGGRIWVESEVGRGSKFYFSLPKTDPSIILYKHLERLVQPGKSSSRNFAVLVCDFDLPCEKAACLEGRINPVIDRILEQVGVPSGQNGDLILRTETFELIFVIDRLTMRQIDDYVRRLKQIVSDQVKKYLNDQPIVPMFGLGVYPDDSVDFKELEKIARRNSEAVGL